MSRPEALAFDMYGTLVNPLRIWQQLEQFIPGDASEAQRIADVEPGLQRLKEAGYTMVVFSNGSPSMLEAIMQTAQLHQYFQGFVSVDEVKVYKPSPKVYRHV